MYITNGKFRNRKIKSLKGWRLIEARVRKSLYNVLKEEIDNKDVLDLFAGIGSMGLESLSWGAKKAVFVDINPQAIDVVRQNLSGLALLDQADLYLKDAVFAIQYFCSRKVKFDFIFLDPPYHKGLLIKSLKTLYAYDILKNSGFLVVLYSCREPFEDIGFRCLFERRYGDRIVRIFTHF